MFPSYFMKSLIFIALIVALTGAGIYVTSQDKNTGPVVRNGTIPLLPQQGNALPMKQVMAKDQLLENNVMDLGRREAVQIFADYSAIDYLVSNILLHWTGSYLVTSDARGPYVDGRLVHFLEKTGIAPSLPQKIMSPDAAKQVQTLWYNAFQQYKAKLLLQTNARDTFVGSSGYDQQADKVYVNGPLSSRIVNELIDLMQYSESPKGMYSNFLVFVRFSKGLESLNDEEKEMLRRMRDEATRLSSR